MSVITPNSKHFQIEKAIYGLFDKKSLWTSFPDKPLSESASNSFREAQNVAPTPSRRFFLAWHHKLPVMHFYPRTTLSKPHSSNAQTKLLRPAFCVLRLRHLANNFQPSIKAPEPETALADRNKKNTNNSKKIYENAYPSFVICLILLFLIAKGPCPNAPLCLKMAFFFPRTMIRHSKWPRSGTGPSIKF